MIIYGSRMYGVKNKVYGHGTCDHCGEYVKHKSYDGRKWGHLYFIPIIPEGKPVRVLKECPKCDRGAHIKQDEIPSIRESLKETLQKCIQASATGAHKFEDEGEEVSTAALLASATTMLHAIGFGEEIPEMIRLLESVNAHYEKHCAEAQFKEIKGDPSGAAQSFEEAARLEPGEAYPIYCSAHLHLIGGNAEAALDCFQQCNKILNNDIGIMLEMAGPLEALKRYDELVDLLDQCIAIAPELNSDKKFMKHHKKMSKKAGRS